MKSNLTFLFKGHSAVKVKVLEADMTPFFSVFALSNSIICVIRIGLDNLSHMSRHVWEASVSNRNDVSWLRTYGTYFIKCLN